MSMHHRPTREYVTPLSQTRLSLRFFCSPETQKDWTVVYWNRFFDSRRYAVPCRFLGGDGAQDTFAAEIETDEPTKYLRYYFAAADESLFFGADGASVTPPESCFEYLCTNELDVFSTPDWAKGAIAYQIFPERFARGGNAPESAEPWDSLPTRENFLGGSLQGILQRLNHLCALHVDVLYLNPIFKAPSNHKYDTEDYFTIDPSFGTLEDLRELTARCHAHGIRVVLDGVFNHCGYRFAPFQDVLEKGAASPYADWFTIDSFPVQTDPPNYECVGYYKWMPKMRMKNPAVRRFFLDVGEYWMRQADIDGWRLDVADEVDFTFWQEFRQAVRAVKADALLIGETWKDGGDMLRGDQMDSVMNYLFRSALARFFASGGSAAEFDARLQHLQALYPPCAQQVLYNLIGSHDTERFLTLCGGDKRKLRLAAAFQMTYTGMPAVYYGDEIGMVGENDPGCRKAMDWRNADLELLSYYETLTALRRAEPALRTGTFTAVLVQENAYGFARRLGGETIYVLFNRSDAAADLRVPALEARGVARSLLGERACTLEPLDSNEINDRFYRFDRMRYRSSFSAVLPAYGVEILKIKEETV